MAQCLQIVQQQLALTGFPRAVQTFDNDESPAATFFAVKSLLRHRTYTVW